LHIAKTRFALAHRLIVLGRGLVDLLAVTLRPHHGRGCRERRQPFSEALACKFSDDHIPQHRQDVRPASRKEIVDRLPLAALELDVAFERRPHG
jgi:hypothetical protein